MQTDACDCEILVVQLVRNLNSNTYSCKYLNEM